MGCRSLLVGPQVRRSFTGAFLGSLLQPLLTRLGLKLSKGVLVALVVVVALFVRWWQQQPTWVHLLVVCAVAALLLRAPLMRRAHVATSWRRPESKPEREPIPPWLRREVIARDDGICGICGFRVKSGEEHIDHVHPVHAGGTNDPDNLQTAHSECNLRKGGMVGWVPPYRRESA